MDSGLWRWGIEGAKRGGIGNGVKAMKNKYLCGFDQNIPINLIN